jgi:hypothetical protein
MRTIATRWLALAWLLGTAGSALAAADCRPAAPSVQVDRVAVPVTVEAPPAPDPARRPARPPVRRSGEIAIEKSATMVPAFAVEARGAQFCALASAVHITVAYRKRAILMPPEVTADGCLNHEMLFHRSRHMRAEEQAVMRAGADATQSLQRYLAANPVAAGATRDAASAAAQSTLDEWFAQWRAGIDADEDRQNAEIDSAAELKRLAAMCGGKAGQFVAAPPAGAMAAANEMVKVFNTLPIIPPPPLPPGPAFQGAIEPITSPLLIKLRPLSERSVVSVTTEPGDRGTEKRFVSVLRFIAERKGEDIVQVRRLISDKSDNVMDRLSLGTLTTDEFGKMKAATRETPLNANFAAQLPALSQDLLPRITRALAAIRVTTFPERGVLSGDVLNSARGNDPPVSYESRRVARGVSTFEGKRVLVVDRSLSLSLFGAGISSQGYELIDLQSGFAIYSDENQVVGDEVRQGTRISAPPRSRTIMRMSDPAVAGATSAVGR